MDLYVSGGQRTPEQSWPVRRAGNSAVLPIDTRHESGRSAAVIAESITSPDAVLFAHSYTAIPALMAAQIHPVSGLVFVEPAFYDAARGVRSVEHHIAAMSTARERLASDDLEGYWAIVRPLMFGGPADPADWAEESVIARRFSERTLPWGHDLPLDVVDVTPTLVVTGAWNDEYEAIAGVLVARGAHHVHLEGHGHRAQDHAGFADAVTDFFGAARRDT